MLESFLKSPMDQLSGVLLVAIAVILSGLVGWEREADDKPAGFRTHMLVGGASAMLVILGETMAVEFNSNDRIGESVRVDPIRVLQAIVVGISFIGAGTILKVEADKRVRYLTTAASVLFCAGIGIAVALHEVLFAAGTTLLVLVINHALGYLEKRIQNP